MLKKFFFFLSSAILLTLSLFFSMQSYLSLGMIYIKGFKEIENSEYFLTTVDVLSMCFLLVVLVVTSLVCIFSEGYMEFYYNKKFFFLMISFLLSMLIFVHSSNFFLMFLGWDGLGVTSIVLIMFYPNKFTLYNSFLTMFFNRLGDVIFVTLLSWNFLNPLNWSYFSNYSFYFFIILMICSLTKSAQYPLSSWLPAAMSAPTPISAMVHSSTLVTAGVFLVMKFYNYFLNLNIMSYLFLFSCFSFLSGGFMATKESDLKKVIAFSTMSQISMVVLFCAAQKLLVALLHVMHHALFKTLLFVVAGQYFVTMFSSQIKLKFFSNFLMTKVQILLMVSLFSMSGLAFSSSFSTKDFMLELGLSQNLMFFLFMIFSSVFTLFYCTKIFMVAVSNKVSNYVFKNKNLMYSWFWLIFLLLVAVSSVFFSKSIYFNQVFVLSKLESFFLGLILLFFLLIKFSDKDNKSLIEWTVFTGFMKTYTFSNVGMLMYIKNIDNISFSMNLFLKKYYLLKSAKTLSGTNFNINILAFFLLLIYLFVI